MSAYCHSIINLHLSFFLSGVSLLRSVSQVTAALKETSRPCCLHPARLSELDLPADRHLMYMYEYGWGCASFYWPVYCCSNIILVCGCQKDIFWTWCGRRGSQKRHYLNSPSEEGTVCQAGWDRRGGFVCAVCMCVRASMWFVVTNPLCQSAVLLLFDFWSLKGVRGWFLLYSGYVCWRGFLKVGDNGYWSSWQMFLHRNRLSPFPHPPSPPTHLFFTDTSCMTPCWTKYLRAKGKWFKSEFHL